MLEYIVSIDYCRPALLFTRWGCMIGLVRLLPPRSNPPGVVILGDLGCETALLLDPNGGSEGLVNLTRLASTAAAGVPVRAPEGFSLIAENGFIAAVRKCDGARVVRVATSQSGQSAADLSGLSVTF